MTGSSLEYNLNLLWVLKFFLTIRLIKVDAHASKATRIAYPILSPTRSLLTSSAYYVVSTYYTTTQGVNRLDAHKILSQFRTDTNKKYILVSYIEFIVQG
jgi:hypothetical protein